MYRLVIIEDERLVIKSLKVALDWQAQGFQIVGEATNGQDGLDLLQTLQPDLALVDVRMPGINGLELIHLARAQGLNTLFLIISGYAEFAYVQKALISGAIGYCLKPFSEREISEGLQKARQQLSERKDQLRLELMVALIDPEPKQTEHLIALLRSAGIDTTQPLTAVILISRASSDERFLTDKGLSCRLGRRKTLLLLPDQELKFLLAGHHPSIPDSDYAGIGVSAPARPDQLKEAIEQAGIAAHHFFMNGKLGLWHEFARIPQDEGNRILQDLARTSERQRCLALLRQLQILHTKGLLSVNHVLSAYNHVIRMLLERGSDWFEGPLHEIEQLVGLYSQAGDVFTVMLNALEKTEQLPITAGEPVRNETARQMIDYVNAHFRSDISVQQLARRFAINPSYISQLFRKELGETFTEYLTRLRIQYACRLLRDTELTINELAEKSGYSDYFYFSRVFKKMLGMTPSQYRSSHFAGAPKPAGTADREEPGCAIDS
jgi:two-component system response regulator YesN